MIYDAKILPLTTKEQQPQALILHISVYLLFAHRLLVARVSVLATGRW